MRTHFYQTFTPLPSFLPPLLSLSPLLLPLSPLSHPPSLPFLPSSSLSPLLPPPRLSGVPGFQRAGSVCDQVHAEGDLQPAAVSPKVPAVRHGGRGGAEQPRPVSTDLPLHPSLSLCGLQDPRDAQRTVHGGAHALSALRGSSSFGVFRNRTLK